MKLENRVAIVTGAGQGIGRVISLALARNGADVVVADVNKDTSAKVAEEIRALGRRALSVYCNVAEEESIVTLVQTTVKELGKVDILVNNVGLRGPVANVVDMDLEGWNNTLAANLTGAMLSCREVLKNMIPRKTGVIISISSDMGRRGYAARSPYVCSKWAQIALTQTLALEVAEHNIRVNCICPGTVEGPRTQSLIDQESERLGVSKEEIHKILVAESAMKRFVKPEEIAAAVVFLAGDEASAITGQSLNVCGGTAFN